MTPVQLRSALRDLAEHGSVYLDSHADAEQVYRAAVDLIRRDESLTMEADCADYNQVLFRIRIDRRVPA